MILRNELLTQVSILISIIYVVYVLCVLNKIPFITNSLDFGDFINMSGSVYVLVFIGAILFFHLLQKIKLIEGFDDCLNLYN